MLIENPEALKIWLTAHIEPLCDADPGALAKYVIALIKKEKPLEELRESMESQMEVFLQTKTADFISELFASLDSKDYLNPPSPPPPTSSSPPPVIKQEEEGDESVTKLETEEKSESPSRDDAKPVGRRSDGDYDRYRPGRRGRSPPHRRRYNRSPRRYRSRSRSPFRRSPNRRRGRSPPYRRSSRSPVRDAEGDLYTPTAAKKRPRCRDYDEKGFCMRGDMCKFDHGVDAVVLEDSSGAAPPPGAPPPYLPAGAALIPDPYVPVAPPPPGGVVLPPLHVPPPGYAVPSESRKRSYEDSSDYPPSKRFDYKRLGGYRGRGRGRGRGGGGGGGGSQVKLAVRNIPPIHNNIAYLNNHFARFGSLVNVQVQFEGDPGSALVTFSSPKEAEAAISSSDAVMGNRFIKMYYHYDKTVPQIPTTPLAVKDRLGDVNKPKDGETVNILRGSSGTILTKTFSNPSLQNENSSETANSAEISSEAAAQKAEEKAAAIAAIMKNQEMLEMKAQLKKESEDKKKEAVKKLTELQKSKQELLEKLIAQQKLLIGKIEKGASAEEKSEIMKLLKCLSANIDQARDDVKKAMSANMGRKTAGELKKELLDAELELFQKQQDGSDTAEIQQKVNALKIEAARCGILPTSTPPRGGRGGIRGYYRGSRGYRGGYYNRGGRARGRGRGFAVGATSVDRRPSKILVSGFEIEDKDEVVLHFQKFGEIIDTIEDDATPSFIFHYKLRRDSEMAMIGGKNYGDRLLQLSWYTSSNNEEFTELEGEHEVEGEEHLEEEDDYTPLDPTYLPPGLEEDKEDGQNDTKDDEQNDDKAVEEVELNADDLLYDDEDEDEERSWKR